MPTRVIKIVHREPVTLIDPITGDRLPGREGFLNFEGFLERLFLNPSWNTDLQHMLAQQSIRASYKRAKDAGEEQFSVAEEDWKKLEKAALEPRIMVNPQAGIAIPGIGFGAGVAGQLLPFFQAVTEAAQVV